mgnify:CR=1 FL=1|uniref:cDNA FLJ31163 fis, clone KIDNE1000050 n=1 Tax=Homo sapiens TaxID=9606 RepID=Q96NA9_HUMAN|nr:Unknown [Homo sapiens]BAB70996.1 unnamed protein product [Homo sapiens]
MRRLSIVMKNPWHSPHPQTHGSHSHTGPKATVSAAVAPVDIGKPGEGVEEISWPPAGSLGFCAQGSWSPKNFQKLTPHVPILLGFLDFSEAPAEGSRCSLECRGSPLTWLLESLLFLLLLPSSSSSSLSISPSLCPSPVPDLAIPGCP